MNKDVIILAIVGMSGCGKSVVVDYLTELGIPKVYFGGMILKEMERRGIPDTPENESFRVAIREEAGPDWVVRQAVVEIKNLLAAGQKRIVLDGVYSWTEYKILKHEFPGQIITIGVVAPKPLRYERIAHRPKRPFSPKEARERDINEIENLEKGGPIAAADYYILNDKTIDNLHAQLKTILTSINF